MAEHLFVSAPDGVKLHVCVHGRRGGGLRPVVCLPGLTRSTADFDTLANALASDQRPVLAIDYRGRGRSEYDSNPRNYNVATELADLLAILTALEVEPAVFVGTSRGGVLAMLLATVRPTALAGVVLNDIGPVVDLKGLVRIKSYVGRLPQPKSLEDAAATVKQLFAAQFPRLTAPDWLAFAHRTFEEQGGVLKLRYDPKLAETFNGMNLERPLPQLWKEFEALASIPVTVIRGSNSDILSAATVETMQARRPDLETIEVPDQGHAPLLAESDVIGRIAAFVARC